MNTLIENKQQAEAVCERCSKRFTYARLFYDETICAECMPQAIAEEEEVDRLRAIESARVKEEAFFQKVEDFWMNLIPSRFTDTDVDHPQFKKAVNEKASKWKPSKEKPWLGIVGMKGCSKTRIAALRLKQAMMAEDAIDRRDYSPTSTWMSADSKPNPSAPAFLTSYEFSKAVIEQYSKDSDEAKQAKFLLKSARFARWLIFDDLGKAKATPAVISELFALIDYRHSHNARMIWTANSTPEEFCEGMPSDVAGPLVRRLKESSTLFAVQ